MQLAPCQYKTGKKLGEGSYAVVREAVHVKTNERFAVKVINKELMKGKEYLIVNEINILKSISKGHANIITLHDYFETPNNLYLVMDLCSGGELFDHIVQRGHFFENDAAMIIKTVLSAIQYLHSHGIVHRDIKPENLLFRNKGLDSLVLTDFGLSKILSSAQISMMTRCGTPGYMAPEVIKAKTPESGGYTEQVDLWSIGVLTYFLLCGYTPFDHEDPRIETQNVLNARYSFQTDEWNHVSVVAKDFVKRLLIVDPKLRMTAAQALEHSWIKGVRDDSMSSSKDSLTEKVDLLPIVSKAFDARKQFKKAIDVVVAVQKLSSISLPRPVEEGKDGVLYVLQK